MGTRDHDRDRSPREGARRPIPGRRARAVPGRRRGPRPRDRPAGARRPTLDFATDASPAETSRLLRGWAEAQYLVGVRFGTVGARRHGRVLEITTFREERYPEDERKPAVTFAKDIGTDLSRRDFTINAMAVRLPDGEFVDPFEGVKDLAAKRLDTPLEPEVAFSDDPLRMLRAARFVSQLGVTPAPRVVEAIARDARPPRDRLGGADPRRARQAARRRSHAGAGLGAAGRDRAGRRVPSRAAGASARAGSGPSAQGRARGTRSRSSNGWSPTRCFASPGCSTTSGSPRPARSRPRASRSTTTRWWARGWRSSGCASSAIPNSTVEDVRTLVELHLRFHGYGDGWTDAAVRRYVRDAGPLLDKLNQLTRADCTTRDPKRGRAVRAPPGRAGGTDRAPGGAGEPRRDAPDRSTAGR